MGFHASRALVGFLGVCVLAAGCCLVLAYRGSVAITAVRNEAHRLFVTIERRKIELQMMDRPHLTTPHFVVYYSPGYRSDAEIVDATLEQYYPQVWEDYGLKEGTTRWPVVVESDPAMVRTFGADPPIGAYWQGTLWFLAPSAWLTEGTGMARLYAQDGPVPHELTHLTNDIVGDGRVPIWLDEGLSQYEDWELSGYVWYVPSRNSFSLPKYRWVQLTSSFYKLPDQPMAFRQVLAATAAICRVGSGTCLKVVAQIGRGEAAMAAIRSVLGAQVFAQWYGAPYWKGTGPVPGAKPGPTI